MIKIFKTIYQVLGSQSSFGLDDFSNAMTENNLAASSGHIGMKALELSTRDDRSRDPLYNQSKSYAEVFRSLGWISSTKNSALDYVFTYLGIHVAVSINPMPLFEESLLGIVYPNEVLDNRTDIFLRPFKTIIIVMSMLGGHLYRDEMILGPLSMDDTNSKAISEVVKWICHLRNDYDILVDELKLYAAKSGIQTNTLQNYTRFPIAALEYVGWIEKERDSDIYGKNLKMLKLTKKGQACVGSISRLVDLRETHLKKMQPNTLNAAIYVAFYDMLNRSGFDVSEMKCEIENRRKILSTELSIDSEMLFSPYQVFGYESVNTVLGLNQEVDSHVKNQDFIRKTKDAYLDDNTKILFVAEQPSDYKLESNFISEVRYMASLYQIQDIIECFFNKCQAYKKEDFYGFVGEMFNAIGLNCLVTRHGINYERWDAIIDEKVDSIPIEIKSPTEEMNISVKGIRQALENKIILLSRKSYPSTEKSTSLLVGNLLPNQRAEVADLIKSIKREYGIKIGVIDLTSLLRLSVQTILSKKMVDLNSIREMEGYIDVEKI
jgi:hypothetical protein